MPRIGTLLVQAGLASEEAIERALAVQRFAGGRLGTLLLEKGAVAEPDLGETLARQHSCDYVPWRILSEVAPTLIAALPAKFAIRHSAVPYERGEGFLRIVLRDPSDLRILDELYFVTGRKVFPAVCPEVRIFQALEKYYGERRSPRFAILAEKLSRPAALPVIHKPLPPPPDFFPSAPTPPAPPLAQQVWEETPELEAGEPPPMVQSWKLPEAPSVGWAGLPATASTQAGESPEPELIQWEDLPPSLWLHEAKGSAAGESSASLPEETRPAPPPPEPPPVRRERAQPPPAPRGAPPAPSRLPDPEDFPDVLAARDRDGAAAAVLEALGGRFARAAIFAARPEGVFGWAGSGKGVNATELRGVEIPWNEPSVFLNVRLSRAFYLGPLPPLPRHRALVQALGGRSEECVVQPVWIRDRPVAFLYAEPEDEQGTTPLDLAFLRALSAAASTALARSIRLRKKPVI